MDKPRKQMVFMRFEKSTRKIFSCFKILCILARNLLWVVLAKSGHEFLSCGGCARSSAVGHWLDPCQFCLSLVGSALQIGDRGFFFALINSVRRNICSRLVEHRRSSVDRVSQKECWVTFPLFLLFRVSFGDSCVLRDERTGPRFRAQLHRHLRLHLLGGGRGSARWIWKERARGATLGDSFRGIVGDWKRLARWRYFHINPHYGMSPGVGTRGVIWESNGIFVECSEFWNQGGHISALPSALRHGHLFFQKIDLLSLGLPLCCQKKWEFRSFVF